MTPDHLIFSPRQIEGSPPIFGEVLFVKMKPVHAIYEPLIGHIILEQSQAGVDRLGHRLVPVKHMDLKVAWSDPQHA